MHGGLPISSDGIQEQNDEVPIRQSERTPGRRIRPTILSGASDRDQDSQLGQFLICRIQMALGTTRSQARRQLEALVGTFVRSSGGCPDGESECLLGSPLDHRVWRTPRQPDTGPPPPPLCPSDLWGGLLWTTEREFDDVNWEV